MKPAAFDYLAPRSLQEAVELLDKYGDSAKLLAGGQTLVPMMNFRLARPDVLIDLNRIEELSYIRECDGALAIGGLTRHRMIELSPVVRQLCPLAHHAAPNIAHAVIRNRGTIGGSLAHADPAAEWALVVVALNGSLVLESPRGRRVVFAREFFVAQLTTTLEVDEIIVEIRLPITSDKVGTAFSEVNRRHGDFALASVAAEITLSECGAIRHLVLALGAIEPVPIDVSHHGERFVEKPIEAFAIDELSSEIVSSIDPISDIHATAEFRKSLITTLLPRVLSVAVARAKAGHDKRH